MKKRTWVWIGIIVVALVLIKILFLSGKEESAAKRPDKNAPVKVTGYVVSPQVLDNDIFASGTISANESVALRPETAGKLENVYFKEGSVVQKGALLAKINDADLRAQQRKLRVQSTLLRDREARLKGLLDINGISKDEYESGANAYQSLNADMDFVQAQIAKTEIRAPFTGRIGIRQISPGSFVTASDVIAVMQQTGQLKIDFSVPEKFASAVAVGDVVSFLSETSGDTAVASVAAIEPGIDEATRSIRVRAVFNNDKELFLPGSFVKVIVHAAKTDDAILVPTQAVIPELKGKKVFVAKDGKAVSVPVETGLRTDAFIQITKGLQPGDTVITTGIMSLKPNAKVMMTGVTR